MKKLIFIFGCTVGIVSFLFFPEASFASWSVHIVSPSGGEQWEAGKTYNIEWNCENLVEVGIALEKGGQQVLEISGSIPASCPNSRFSWTIPGNTPKGGDYKIKVYDEDEMDWSFPPTIVNVLDISGYFTIFNESNEGLGTCYAPTGEITASKTIVQPGEEFTISVKGYDDNRVLKVCHNDACLPCDDNEKNQCSKSWKYALPNPNIYYFFGKVEDSDLSLDYCSKNNTAATEPPSVTVTVASAGSCAALCAPQKTLFLQSDCETFGFPGYNEATGICSYDCSNKGRTFDSGGKNCICYSEAPMDKASCLAKKSSQTAPTAPTTPGAGTTPQGGSQQAYSGGLQPPIKAKTFEELAGGIGNFIFWVAMALVPILFMIAAFYILTAGANPNQVATGKRIMIYTAIGLAVILLAKGLVSVLQNVLGVVK